MKKLLALALSVLFGGTILMVAGCAPKQDAGTEQAPVVEEATPGAAMGMTPAAGVQETAPAAEE